ncbi:hypothetical protein BCR34DRAFT_556715, partial [Clohesyomyces aquaticus]
MFSYTERKAQFMFSYTQSEELVERKARFMFTQSEKLISYITRTLSLINIQALYPLHIRTRSKQGLHLYKSM